MLKPCCQLNFTRMIQQSELSSLNYINQITSISFLNQDNNMLLSSNLQSANRMITILCAAKEDCRLV